MGTHERPISLVIVDDHAILRHGLAKVLELEGFKVVGDFENGHEAIEAIPVLNPDIALMDFEMPVMDGVTATKWLQTNFPKCKVIALSMRSDDLSVIRMLRAGARGYVSKGLQPAELVQAINAVQLNGYHYSELFTNGLSKMHHPDAIVEDSAKIGLLSEREIEFLKLCVTEMTYKEMAKEMNVSSRTIDGYRESVCNKFELKSRAGLALLAVKLKIASF
jgi:two-component system, NarL family, invasion response regulator UvrY